MKYFQILFNCCLLLFAGLASNPLMAAYEDELGCVRGDCVNGDGILIEITDHGRTFYRGTFVNGKLNGFGRMHYEDEYIYYKGYFRSGLKHGRGTLWNKEGDVYIGQWKNDRRNGQGSQFFKVQDWEEDKYTELWMMERTENYTGNFKNDVFFGEGTYRWEDGTKYVGEWAANKKHGDGYFDYGNGRRSIRKYEFDVKVFE